MLNAQMRLVTAALLATLSFASPMAYGEEPKRMRPLEGERVRPLAAERIDTQMVLQAAAARKLPQGMSARDQEALKKVVAELKAGRRDAANSSWQNFSQNYFSKATAKNLDALIQWVLRESYLETNKDLAFAADKARFYSDQQRTLKEYLDKVRKVSDQAKTDDLVRIRPIRLEENFLKGKEAARWGPWKNVTQAQLSEELRSLEKRLSTIGDDAQMANLDLQNWLQKQQQVMQTMSNISKMLHDTALATIRKIGG